MNVRTRISVATFGVTVATLATAASPLAAQKAGIGFGAAIGANVPNGEFADGAKTGLVANGFVGVGTGRFGLRGELFWSRSDLDNAFIRKVGNTVLPGRERIPLPATSISSARLRISYCRLPSPW